MRDHIVTDTQQCCWKSSYNWCGVTAWFVWASVCIPQIFFTIFAIQLTPQIILVLAVGQSDGINVILPLLKPSVVMKWSSTSSEDLTQLFTRWVHSAIVYIISTLNFWILPVACARCSGKWPPSTPLSFGLKIANEYTSPALDYYYFSLEIIKLEDPFHISVDGNTAGFKPQQDRGWFPRTFTERQTPGP